MEVNNLLGGVEKEMGVDDFKSVISVWCRVLNLNLTSAELEVLLDYEIKTFCVDIGLKESLQNMVEILVASVGVICNDLGICYQSFIVGFY